MMRASRWLVAAALAGLGTAAVALLAGGTASAAGAASEPVTGWWSATNLGAAAAPAPPDVKPGDLFVQGSNAAPAGVVPRVPAPPSSLAISAVTFQLATGARPVRLTLPLDPAATPPSQISVVACRATATFKPVQNGPYADAPSYASDGCAAGALTADGKSVTFGKLDGVARPAVLSVVLVPGPLDRIVLSAPKPSALQVSEPVAIGGSFNPAGPRGGGVPGGAPGTEAGGSADLASSGSPGLDAAGVEPSPSAAIPQPPAVAVPAAGGGLPPVAERPAARAATTLSRRSRLLAGLGLAALLGFALFGLRGQLPVSTAGPQGLVRAPPGGLTSAPSVLRGIGRFRAARVGSAPRL